MMDKDHTAIDIDFDPSVQRMSGVAYHGNTPFDVPFISHIDGNLWQGGCRNGLIVPDNIDVVISLYPWEKYTLQEGQIRLEYKMYDSEDQGFDQVIEIAMQVNRYLDHGKTVLVHCQAGLNRSGLVAATALMLKGMSGPDAIKLLREKRSNACLCNPSFARWVFDEEYKNVI